MKKFIIVLVAICSFISTYAQGLYSKSLGATDITGIWTDGTTIVENRNAISSDEQAVYVAEHIGAYKNIRFIQTYKFEYKENTYFIWAINHVWESQMNYDIMYMYDYLVLTESQNDMLNKIAAPEVSLVQLPMSSIFDDILKTDEKVENGIKKSILEKDDFQAHTYCLTARMDGDYVLFNYEIDSWTYHGDINNRTYEKLDLIDNLDGGYFKIPKKEWDHLFFR